LNYHQLEYFLSKPRFDRFLQACNHSEVKAQALYGINLKVCQATYPILNLFETALRNSIDCQISSHFNDPNWIINQKNGFMSHSSLSMGLFKMRNTILKTENDLTKKKAVITAGKIIAEQSFGFWTSLFEPHHYKLIKGAVMRCFPHKPSTINRSNISVKLNKIREFRNRIYHNEPVCFQDNTISFEYVQAVINELYEVLRWMDKDLENYVKDFDDLTTQINLLNDL
jgi:hypothetical protein